MSIEIILSMNGKNVKVTLENVEKQMDKTAGKMNKSLSKVGKFDVGGLATKIMKPFAIVGGLIAGAAAAAKVFLSRLDAIGKGADGIGVTTKAYQELRYAANKSAADMNKVEAAVAKIGELQKQAAEGSQAAAKSLESLNLTWKDLAGLSPDEQFRRVAQELNKISDPAKKLQAAIDILGRKNAIKLMPMINSFEQLKEDANSLNVIIAEDTIRAAEAAGTAWSNMMDKMVAAIARAGVVEWIREVIDGLDEFFNKTTQKAKATQGVYNRESGVDYAIDQAEKSGKYTKKEIEEMRKHAFGYGQGRNAILGGTKAFIKIDKVLKDAGLGALARTKTSGFGQFSGSADIASLVETPEQRAAKEKERREKKAAEAADRAAEQQAAVDEVQKKAVDDLLSAEREKAELLQAELSGSWQLSELEKVKLQLRKRGLDLSEAEIARITEQLQLQGELRLKKQQSGKADELRYQAELKFNKKLAKQKRALREAEKTKGSALTEEETNLIKKLADLEYRLNNQPELKFSDLDTKTNELTARGGFASGAAAPNADRVNQQIAAQGKRQVELLEKIETELKALGGY